MEAAKMDFVSALISTEQPIVCSELSIEQAKETDSRIEGYLVHSRRIASLHGIAVIALIIAIVGALYLSYRLSQSLDASLKNTRTVSATEARNVRPAADRMVGFVGVANDFEKLIPNPSDEVKQAMISLSISEQRLRDISEVLSHSAKNLEENAAGENPAPIVADPEDTPRVVINSVMEGVLPDPARKPHWLKKLRPNIVELYYLKSDTGIGGELRGHLGNRGAFILPPSPTDSTQTKKWNSIRYYHEQDQKLAQNIRQAMLDFFASKNISINLPEPIIPKSFNRWDVQVGQVALYICDIPPATQK